MGSAGKQVIVDRRGRATGDRQIAADDRGGVGARRDVVRQGRDFAILAVGTMVNQALAAAELLAADGVDVSVVNCRYMKPYDEVTLNAILASHTHVLTVEEGTIVNGFGSFISSVIHRQAPTVRTAVHGVPDRIIYSAPRKKQLAALGLDPAGIADRVRAMHDSEALAS